jgi:hypothetical protein
MRVVFAVDLTSDAPDRIIEPYWIYGLQGVEDGALVHPARVGHD